jgi:hypothetical protein
MPRRFTGIRLLLVFVFINTVLFLMLVTSMTSAHPWLANVLPGQFGGDNSGYWVFFALVLLVNAITVLLAGIVLVFPALLDSPLDERRLDRLLTDRGGISEEARNSVLAVVREEAASARYQIAAGRAILIAGAIFLILAFGSVTATVAHALPSDSLFANAAGPVGDAAVTTNQVWRFTADQVMGAILLDIPEIYHWYLSDLVNNTHATVFTSFIFAFRALLGWVTLATILTLLRALRLPKPKRAAPLAAPKKPET